MSTPGTDRLVADYLKRLRTELRDLPRDRRREIEEEISAHIAEARSELLGESEARIRALLDRLGDPADIAAEEWARYGEKPSKLREVAAIVLLLLGGFAFFVGWIVGVILLWASDAWTTRDKLIGTLILPGGLLASLYVFFIWAATATPVVCDGSGSCSSSGDGSQIGWTILGVALLAAPLGTTVYLSVRMRPPRPVLA